MPCPWLLYPVRAVFREMEVMSIEGNTYKQGSMIAGRYIVAELIGQGSLSDVYRCIDVSTQKMVCLKMIFYASNTNLLR